MLNIHLTGVPRVEREDGTRIDIRSRKGIALLALLALSRRHECSRVWLQQMLWSASGQKQAQSSLRRELSTLRATLGDPKLVEADHRTVRLDSSRAWIDVLADDFEASGQLLEGVDLPHEDEFEDWLREARASDRPSVRGRPPKLAPVVVASAPREAGSTAWQPRVLIEPVSRVGPLGDDDYEGAIENALGSILAMPQTIKAGWLSERDEGGGPPYCLRGVIAWGRTRPEVRLSLVHCADGSIVCSSLVPIDPESHFTEELKIVGNSLPYVIDQHQASLGGTSLTARLCTARARLNSCTLAGIRDASGQLASLRALPEAAREVDLLELQLGVTRAWMGLRMPASGFQRLSARAQWVSREQPLEARAPMMAGIIDMITGCYDAAAHWLSMAIALNPSFALAHALAGAVDGARGRHEEGLAAIELALSMALHDPYRFLMLGERDALVGAAAGRRPAHRALRLLRPARYADFEGPSSRALIA